MLVFYELVDIVQYYLYYFQLSFNPVAGLFFSFLLLGIPQIMHYFLQHIRDQLPYL